MPQKTYGVIVVAWINLLEYVYPVGSVYFSINDISPSQTIGGTWSKLTGGCLGLADSDGFADAGSNGGSRTITIEQMPSHSHEWHGTNHSTTVTSRWGYYSIWIDADTDKNWPGSVDIISNTGGGAGLYSRSFLCLRLDTNFLVILFIPFIIKGVY